MRLNVLNIRGGRGFSPASPLAALPRVPYLSPPAADLQSPTAESAAEHRSMQPPLGGMRVSGRPSRSGDAESSPNGVSPSAAAADGNGAAGSHTSNARQSSPAGGSTLVPGCSNLTKIHTCGPKLAVVPGQSQAAIAPTSPWLCKLRPVTVMLRSSISVGKKASKACVCQQS